MLRSHELSICGPNAFRISGNTFPEVRQIPTQLCRRAQHGLRHIHQKQNGSWRTFCVAAPSTGGTDESTNVKQPLAHFLKSTNGKLLVIVSLSLVLWCIPRPAGVSAQGWKLFAIFVGTIAGIVVQPLPLGAVALLGLLVAMVTNAMTFQQAFAAYSTETPWLIVVAIWLAAAIQKSGLGERLGYSLVALIGGSPLGLAYALVIGEAALAPAIPSVAARSGGIMLPIAKSLAEACDSRPDTPASSRRLGSFLVFTLFQTSAISSAMFLTANHPNPLSASLALSTANVALTWGRWATAALVPGVTCLLVVPLVVYLLDKPQLASSKAAKAAATRKLDELGGLGGQEKTVLLAMGVTIGLWVAAAWLRLSVVAAALVGLMILLLTKVLTWQDCSGNKSAWTIFTWFAAVIAMASQLKQSGLVDVFSNSIASWLQAMTLPWQASFAALVILYFYSHYLFASNASHVSAMFAGFLSVSLAVGVPPMLAALVLAFLSNVQGVISSYGMSHAPLYYGLGYVPLGKWMYQALVVSVVNLVVWLLVGGAWWKVLGYW